LLLWKELAAVLLADEFFRLAHNDATGRPLLHPRAMGIGLAAALLAELIFAEKIIARDERLCVVDLTPPRDALAHTTLDQLASDPQQHAIRTWLGFLAQTSYESVAQRLWRAGEVRREESRRLLSRAVVYVPVDPNVAAWPSARLSMRLREGRPLDQFDAFLVGLAAATELDGHVLDGAPPKAFAYLRYVIANVWPPVRQLLPHTEAAIGDAVLRHRI
jgi:hypothetical protein